MSAKGGRFRPPFLTEKLLRALSWIIPGGAALLLSAAALAQPPRFRPPVNRIEARQRLAQRLMRDPGAIEMLRRMLKPSADYAGEQITERGGVLARLRILGDTHGRVRRDFLSPENLQGDVMLTTAGNYRYFHRRSNTMDIALWPTEFNERDKRMLAMIRGGLVSVRRVGEEVIAGRKSTIIAVTAERPEGGLNNQVKFWIDPETGIQLKHEIANANGLVSRSYLTSLAIGAEANVKPRDFELLPSPGMRVTPLFPKTAQFRTMEEARDRLPFKPLEPGALPMGFQLNGVWVFTPPEQRPGAPGSVLLRYSDGVSNFSLFQRIGRAPAGSLARRGFPLGRGFIRHWRIPLSRLDTVMEVTYIGLLTPEQAEALHDSLR